MSKPHKTDFMALIAGEVAPSAQPAAMDPGPVITLKPPAAKPTGIKQRCHQLSLYLEDPVFDQMRSIAFEERVKMHQLLLEAVDLLLKKRGAPSIRELIRKAG
jgi:hypothetical protein